MQISYKKNKLCNLIIKNSKIGTELIRPGLFCGLDEGDNFCLDISTLSCLVAVNNFTRRSEPLLVISLS